MTKLDLIVKSVSPETALIRRIVFARADGAPLPGYAAGAHITLDVPGVGARKYSLVNADTTPSATAHPLTYATGVRLEINGGGGSRYIHSLQAGDRLSIEPPQNNFSLKPTTGRTILIAGGIGVTPLISMAAELRASGRPFQFVYAARADTEFAFKAELLALAGDQIILHADDAAERVFDMAGFFATLAADERVYTCGPKPMLKAGMDAARKLGWPRDRLAFELFYSVASPAAPQPATDGSFEVVLNSSGKSYRVPPDKSILDVLIAAGVDPLHDCKRGECGVCQVGVIEGIPDHKDAILSAGERAANKVMQICISRSKSPRLVLDL
jgi:ferredoxin-NADP reductase